MNDNQELRIRTILYNCDDAYWDCSYNCESGCGMTGACDDCNAQIKAIENEVSNEYKLESHLY
jgi:ferredoxin